MDGTVVADMLKSLTLLSALSAATFPSSPVIVGFSSPLHSSGSPPGNLLSCAFGLDGEVSVLPPVQVDGVGEGSRA